MDNAEEEIPAMLKKWADGANKTIEYKGVTDA